MVRSIFIQRRVLDIYRSAPISFPIDPLELIRHLNPPCKTMTYQSASSFFDCQISEISAMCGSSDATTFFQHSHNRYLLLYNADMPSGRLRWTLCHELGHIMLGHFQLTNEADSGTLESEADQFAWTLLAPLPILRELGIESSDQIADTFGLSSEASRLHLRRYKRWRASHIKTAWENQMLALFKRRLRPESIPPTPGTH